MLITFQAFRTAINTLVFPDSQAEQRVPLFRNFIVNGLIQMTTYVESYQSVNVNFYDKDQSFDDCGLSILQGCRGQIGAVYSFKPSCRCQRFFYEPASLEKLSCLYERCRCEAAAACCGQTTNATGGSVYTQNPYYCGDYIGGNQGCTPPYLAAEPEDDCAFKASERYFAIGPNQKIWLYPRFPCGHILGVHWRGIRRSYLDNDYVPDDDDLKDAIACYVESQVAKRVDKDQATADKLYADYRMKIGDIIFREEQDLRPRATRVCIEGLDQSELVQIYPVNLYPVEVGESCAAAAGVAIAPVADTEPSPNFYWNLDEASGARVDEIAGLELTQQSPTVGVAAGLFGNALHFTPQANQTPIMGTAITTSLAYAAGGSFEALFWIKVAIAATPSGQALPVGLRFYDAGNNLISSFGLRYAVASGSKQLILEASNNGDAIDYRPGAGVTLSLATWHFIRVYYDGATGKIGLWLDNGFIGESTGTIILPAEPKGELRIWQSGNASGVYDDFLVDEFALFMRRIADDYATSIFNGGAGRTWPF